VNVRRALLPSFHDDLIDEANDSAIVLFYQLLFLDFR